MIITIINIIMFLNLFLLAFKFISTKNSEQKIISFYFIFTQIIILILFNWQAKPQFAIDIAVLLFLLELVAVLFLLLHKKTNDQ